MAATLTLTGSIGPGVAITAGVYTLVTEFEIDAVDNVIRFVRNGTTTFMSVAAATTVTATKSGSTWTLTIS